MSLRHWKDTDFATKDAVQDHIARCRDHWYWVGYCHFWLLGRGMTALVRRQDVDDQERKIAERERVRHGWTMETLNYAREHARQRGDQVPLGEVSVERDWPESFKRSDARDTKPPTAAPVPVSIETIDVPCEADAAEPSSDGGEFF